jgi:nucleolar protein 56
LEDFESVRKRALGEAKQAMSEAYSTEDHALIQAINSYLELSKSNNLIAQRLTEWFGIYFPEAKIESQKQIAQLSIIFADSESGEITESEVESVLEDKEKSKHLHSKMKSTKGRSAEVEEKAALKSFALSVNTTTGTLEMLDKYIEDAAKRIMPNTTYLTDSKTAAELLSKAGSMERLASMPSSTIQLLGAEKALFKHIKFGSKPPKYGILFKFSVVNMARYDLRGKIARAYAAKIAIALKADHFSKNFIADKLKEKLDQTVKAISEKPEPPQKKWVPRRDFNNNRGFDRNRGSGGNRQGGGGGGKRFFRRPSGGGGGRPGGERRRRDDFR